MWYKSARDSYTKANLFDNLDQVARTVWKYIPRVRDGGKTNLQETSKLIAQFNSQNVNLSSTKLKITIPIRFSEKSGDGNLGTYNNLGTIYINPLHYLVQQGRVDYKFIKGILIHEIQHAVEHYYYKDNYMLGTGSAEKKKNNQWTQSAYQSTRDEGIDNPEDQELYFKYYNAPTEVRARLAEVMSHYGLPAQKENMRAKTESSNNFSTYKQLISDVLTPKHKYIMNFLSKEAVQYMAKELYKAIWN